MVEQLPRNARLTVGTTAVNVSLRNFSRKGISLRNSSTGSQVISLSFSENETAVANSGIVLSAGSVINDFDGEGYKCWKGTITAISSAAGAVLSIYEMVQ